MGEFLAALGGAFVGSGFAGLVLTRGIARLAKRLDEAECRIAAAELDRDRRRDESRALRADMKGLEESIDALAEGLRDAFGGPAPTLSEGGAGMACTDVTGCEHGEACDDGCVLAIDPCVRTIPIGFDHPDAEDTRDGDDDGQDARGAGGGT